MASEIAFAQSGVDGECLSRMEFPIIIGGITDLKGNQNGKFHGITTIKNEIRLKIDFNDQVAREFLPSVGPSG